MRRLAAAMALALCAGQAAAQHGNPLPVPEESRSRTTSSTDIYRRESAFKKKYEGEADRRRELEAEMARLRSQMAQPPPGGEPEAATPQPVAAAVSAGSILPVPRAPVPRPRRAAAVKAAARAQREERPAEPQPMVFAVTAAAEAAARRETVVPLGSYVKARVLTGVEANTLETYPVLLQLDYAFIGPNHTRVDLSHCFVIAKAKANLSTERVLGETTQLSCVREDSEVVTRTAKGYLAGEDSTFGLTGQLISHQGKVLLTAVLAGLAKGVGEAVATAQTTTAVVGGNGTVAQGTNVTGSKLAFAAGKAVTEPATLIANWYLEYAKQLVPSIAVGSGRDVWIVLLDTVQVPPLSADEEGEEW